LFIGPYDLSQSLGFPGQISHPKVKKEIMKIKDMAKSKNIRLGAFADTIETYQFLVNNGFDYIAYSVDINLFINGLKNLKSELCK
jgi:4-hydroxy-2-oxoheptanedioate aldolase